MTCATESRAVRGPSAARPDPRELPRGYSTMEARDLIAAEARQLLRVLPGHLALKPEGTEKEDAANTDSINRTATTFASSARRPRCQLAGSDGVSAAGAGWHAGGAPSCCLESAAAANSRYVRRVDADTEQPRERWGEGRYSERCPDDWCGLVVWWTGSGEGSERRLWLINYAPQATAHAGGGGVVNREW